jgi:hypothetical protein
MSSPIVITLRLVAAEAKRRIAERIEILLRDYINKLAYSEDGDAADIRVVAFRIAVALGPCRADRQDPKRAMGIPRRPRREKGEPKVPRVPGNQARRHLFDRDHHVGGFDNRIGVRAPLQIELFNCLVCD